MSAFRGFLPRPISKWSDAELLQAWFHPHSVGIMKNAVRNEMSIRGLLCPNDASEIDSIS